MTVLISNNKFGNEQEKNYTTKLIQFYSLKGLPCRLVVWHTKQQYENLYFLATKVLGT